MVKKTYSKRVEKLKFPLKRGSKITPYGITQRELKSVKRYAPVKILRKETALGIKAARQGVSLLKKDLNSLKRKRSKDAIIQKAKLRKLIHHDTREIRDMAHKASKESIVEGYKAQQFENKVKKYVLGTAALAIPTAIIARKIR